MIRVESPYERVQELFHPKDHGDGSLLHLHEAVNIRRNMAKQDLEMKVSFPQDMLALLKVKQIRGILIQSHLWRKLDEQAGPDLDYNKLTSNIPIALLPNEKLAIRQGLAYATVQSGRIDDLSKSTDLRVELIQLEFKKGHVPTADEVGRQVVWHDPSETRWITAAFETNSAFLSDMVDKDCIGVQGEFSGVLCMGTNGSRDVFLHEWLHTQTEYCRKALLESFGKAWGKSEIRDGPYIRIIERYGEENGYIGKVIYISMKDHFFHFLASAKNELISYYDYSTNTFGKGLDRLKERQKGKDYDRRIPYDYFHEANISEYHVETENIPFVIFCRDLYDQAVVAGAEAVCKLRDYLDKSNLARNLGLTNQEIIHAMMRQNPLASWPRIFEAFSRESDIDLLKKGFGEVMDLSQKKSFTDMLEFPWVYRPPMLPEYLPDIAEFPVSDLEKFLSEESQIILEYFAGEMETERFEADMKGFIRALFLNKELDDKMGGRKILDYCKMMRLVPILRDKYLDKDGSFKVVFRREFLKFLEETLPTTFQGVIDVYDAPSESDCLITPLLTSCHIALTELVGETGDYNNEAFRSAVLPLKEHYEQVVAQYADTDEYYGACRKLADLWVTEAILLGQRCGSLRNTILTTYRNFCRKNLERKINKLHTLDMGMAIFIPTKDIVSALSEEGYIPEGISRSGYVLLDDIHNFLGRQDFPWMTEFIEG